MELIDAIKARHSVRKYSDKPIEVAKVATLRATFIFDEKGILERIIEKVDTKNAAKQILEG